jgi:hypothetical protein
VAVAVRRAALSSDTPVSTAVAVADSVPATTPPAVTDVTPARLELRHRTLERLGHVVHALRRHQDSITEAWKGATDEEKAERIERLNALRQEAVLQLNELEGQAGELDPDVLLEFLGTPDGQFARLRLAPVLAAAADAGIAGEESTGGPLLKGLLPLAGGTGQDRMFLLAVAKSMNRPNREIGEACFKVLEDSHGLTRQEAAATLCEQAVHGRLKGTISERAPELQKLAREISEEARPIKMAAFQALTVVDTPEMDEFLVHQVEASGDSRQMFERADILIESAPRILHSHAHRIATLVKKSLDEATESFDHFQFVRLSARLPKPVGLETLRHLASRIRDGDKAAVGLEWIIQRIEQDKTEELLARMDRLKDYEKKVYFLQAMGAPPPEPRTNRK